jgi:hypothetical protein
MPNPEPQVPGARCRVPKPGTWNSRFKVDITRTPDTQTPEAWNSQKYKCEISPCQTPNPEFRVPGPSPKTRNSELRLDIWDWTKMSIKSPELWIPGQALGNWYLVISLIYKMLCTEYSTFDFYRWYLIFDTWSNLQNVVFQVPGFGTRHPAPGTRNSALGDWYLVICLIYKMLYTGYWIFNFYSWYSIPSTWWLVLFMKCCIPGFGVQNSEPGTQNLELGSQKCPEHDIWYSLFGNR